MAEDKTKLTDEEIKNEISGLTGWRIEEAYLKKDFIFQNFFEINAFLPYMANTIVEHNHHPDFSLDTGKKKVSMSMTTHSAGGLTRADIALAHALNNWAK